MKKLGYSFIGLVLAASAAHAQSEPATPAEPAEPAQPATATDPAADGGAIPAETATPAQPATPAEPAVTAAADVTEAEIDSFAKATVRLQEIQADATIAADAKQQAMIAAVAEAGLDPAQYNAIGRAAQADPELRAKVQTAMSRHVGHTDG
jgi:hypothetical protein